MTEWEKVRKDDRSVKAFSVLAQHTRDSVANIQKKFDDIDRTFHQDAEAGVEDNN